MVVMKAYKRNEVEKFMDTFWNTFHAEQKFNIFLGDEYCQYDNTPSRKDLSSLIFHKIPDSLKNRVRDRSSLIELSQTFLDSALSSRKNLLTTIQESFDPSSLDCSCYSNIINSKKFEAIFSMNFFLSLEQNFHDKIQAIFPFTSQKQESVKIPFYRILGEIKQKENLFLSSQDFKKLMFLDFYTPFWKELREELVTRPTLLVGFDLENKDCQTILSFLFQEIRYEKQPIYLVTSNSVLNTGVLNFINQYDIKVLTYDLNAFQQHFFSKEDDVQKQFLR